MHVYACISIYRQIYAHHYICNVNTHAYAYAERERESHTSSADEPQATRVIVRGIAHFAESDDTPCVAETVPALQSVHTWAPGSEEYFPTSHSEHSASAADVAPGDPNLPAAQGEPAHTDAPGKLGCCIHESVARLPPVRVVRRHQPRHLSKRRRHDEAIPMFRKQGLAPERRRARDTHTPSLPFARPSPSLSPPFLSPHPSISPPSMQGDLNTRKEHLQRMSITAQRCSTFGHGMKWRAHMWYRTAAARREGAYPTSQSSGTCPVARNKLE